jgi:hypothetical protein
MYKKRQLAKCKKGKKGKIFPVSFGRIIGAAATVLVSGNRSYVFPHVSGSQAAAVHQLARV